MKLLNYFYILFIFDHIPPYTISLTKSERKGGGAFEGWGYKPSLNYVPEVLLAGGLLLHLLVHVVVRHHHAVRVLNR